MPAIMPPINPNIIAALGQYFGGMQNRGIRTPPFVKPGGMVNRGEVLGRPAQPTPGLPQTLPPSQGPATGFPSSAPGPTAGPASGIPLPAGTAPGNQAGAPGAPVQPPAQAGNRVWNALTDPSLAGVALAAGQQLTRARYPGESGISNAVSAVTSGYNQLAQQRQMQYARELAERERKMKEQEAFQKTVESNARIKDLESQATRREAQSTQEQNKWGLEERQFEQKKLDDDWNKTYKLLEQARLEGRDAAEQAHWKALEGISERQTKASEKTATLAEAKFAEDTRQFNLGRIDKNALDQSRLQLEAIRTNASATQAKAAMMRAGAEHLTPHVNTATRVVLNQINKARETAVNNGDPFTEPDDEAVTERIMQVAGGMANKPAAAAPAPANNIPSTSAPPGPGEQTKSTNVGTMILRGNQWVRYVPAP